MLSVAKSIKRSRDIVEHKQIYKIFISLNDFSAEATVSSGVKKISKLTHKFGKRFSSIQW